MTERPFNGRASASLAPKRAQLLERLAQFNAEMAARREAQARRAAQGPPGPEKPLGADRRTVPDSNRGRETVKDPRQSVAHALNDRNASAATTMRAMQASGPKRGPNLPRGLQTADALEQLRLIQSRRPIDIRRDPELDNPPVSHMRDDLARQHQR